MCVQFLCVHLADLLKFRHISHNYVVYKKKCQVLTIIMCTCWDMAHDPVILNQLRHFHLDSESSGARYQSESHMIQT